MSPRETAHLLSICLSVCLPIKTLLAAFWTHALKQFKSANKRCLQIRNRLAQRRSNHRLAILGHHAGRRPPDATRFDYMDERLSGHQRGAGDRRPIRQLDSDARTLFGAWYAPAVPQRGVVPVRRDVQGERLGIYHWKGKIC